MKLVIHGKNIKITEAIREYLHRKLKRAARNFRNITGEINVYISMAQNPRVTAKHSAEVNIFLTNGSVLRAEEISENLYVSIDLVADKITRNLRKYKERRQRKITHARSINELISMGNSIGDLIGKRIPELPS